jgi:hypothetical protein
MNEQKRADALGSTPATVTVATPPSTTTTLSEVSWSVALWDPGWDLGADGGAVVFQVTGGSGALAVILASKETVLNPPAAPAPFEGDVYAAGIRPDEGSPGVAWIGKSSMSGGISAFLASDKNFTLPATPFWLWVSYQPDGTITIGQDRFVGQNPLVQYQDPQPLSGIRYVGLMLPAGGPVNVSAIELIPNVPVQYQLISENIAVPDPTSDDYSTISITPSASAQPFNGNVQIVNQVEISGMSIKTSTDSSLASLNNAQNIESLTIYADTVEIDQTLNLPQTTVTIYARNLIFSGAAARIVTTPVFKQNTPATTLPGDKGLDGGSITLNIGSFKMQNGATTAFDLTGCEGQPGGPGNTPITTNMSGTPFDPFYPENASNGGPSSTGFGGSNIVFYYYTYNDTEDTPTSNESVTQGTQAWPEDGPAANAAGVPGDGGDGGKLISTIDIKAQAGEDVLKQPGGKSGTKGADMQGAPAGTPNPAYWQIYHYEYHGGCQQGSPNISWSNPSHTSQPGNNAPAPSPAHPAGNPGTYAVAGSPAYSWLHPYNLQVALSYVADAYLNGQFNTAQQILSAYDQALNAYTAPPAAFQTAFSQAVQTITNLLNRLAANLDYYGNPAGWVPMLSFQSNLAIYQAEVQAAIPQMYLAYRILNAASSVQSATQMLTTGITQLQSDIQTAMQAYAAADSELSSIDAQIGNVITQLNALTPQLEQLQQKLLEEARKDVEEEHEALFFVRLLAGIAQMFPIGQPALGAIGTGLNIISNIDTSKPLDTFNQLGDLLAQYKDSNPDGSADATKEKQDSGDVNNPADAGINAKSLIEASTGVINGLKIITTGFQGLSVSNEEVEAKLKQIEAANVYYQFYVGQINNLNVLKETLAAQLKTTLQQLVEANNTINSDLLKIDNMYTQRALEFALLNHQALIFAKDMGQSARDRLVRYQYYLVKSYEYLMLEAYGQADYQLNAVVKAFQNLESNQRPDGTLTPADYQQLTTVYNTVLVNIADQILTKYESQPIQKTTKFVVPLTADQLAALNANNQVTMNLMAMNEWNYDWEGVRITNVATNFIELSDGSSAGDNGTNEVTEQDRSSSINQVELTFTLGGISPLTYQGNVYAFKPDTSSGNMNWGTTFNVQSGGSQRLVAVVPDPATESMLEQLLKSIGNVDPSPLTDYQPSASADITVSMKVLPSGTSATITSLKLEFDFTFMQAPANQAALSIQTFSDTTPAVALAPLILLNQPDLSGNASGQGSFFRIFAQYQAVQVTAPETFGDYVFSRWQYPNGEVASTSRSINCTLNDDLLLQCVYAPQSPNN